MPAHSLAEEPAPPFQLPQMAAQSPEATSTASQGQIFVAGHPIAKSVTPDFHYFIFESLGVPWTVSLLETVDPAVLQDATANPNFVGAAVSLPLKSAVAPFLDRLDKDAEDLQSVNTIFVHHLDDGTRELVGANSDWRGMRDCISTAAGIPSPWCTKSGQPTALSSSAAAGVVIGGGVLSRTAVYALAVGLGLRTIYVVGCDREQQDAIHRMLDSASLAMGLTLTDVDSTHQADNCHIRPHVIVNATRTAPLKDPEYEQAQLIGKHFLGLRQPPLATENNHNAAAEQHVIQHVLLDMAYTG